MKALKASKLRLALALSMAMTTLSLTAIADLNESTNIPSDTVVEGSPSASLEAQSKALLGSKTKAELPKVIFLIHGLKGQPIITFNNFIAILKKELSPLVPDLHVFFLHYNTNDPKLDHEQALAEINQQILNDFKREKLDINTPFSFIMHSQGGVIGYKYVLNCIKKNACGATPLPTKLKHFITIGTPLWGSVNATAMAKKEFEFLFPPEQTKQLSMGSDSLTENRLSFFRDKPTDLIHDWTSPFPSETIIYNVAGDVSRFMNESKIQPLAKFLGVNQHQSDLVVDVPLARLDFHYHIEDELNNYLPKTGTTQLAPNHYLAFQMPHLFIPRVDGIGPFEGLAYGSSAEQPVVKNILRVLKGEEITTKELKDDEKSKKDDEPKLAETLATFASEIKIILPKEYERALNLKETYIKIRESGNGEKIEKTTIGNSPGSTSHGISTSFANGKPHHYHTYYHLGTFKEAFAYKTADDFDKPIQNQTSLSYSIDVPGWQSKTFPLTVSPSYSSYAEAYLFPNQPLPIVTIGPRTQIVPGSIVLNTAKSLFSLFKKEKLIVVNRQSGQVSVSTPGNQIVGSVHDQISEAGQCYTGKVGLGLKAGVPTYPDFKSTVAGTTLAPNEKVEIVGRMSDGKLLAKSKFFKLSEYDRYLIVLPKQNTLAWVKVTDLDVVGESEGILRTVKSDSHPCSPRVFLSAK